MWGGVPLSPQGGEVWGGGTTDDDETAITRQNAAVRCGEDSYGLSAIADQLVHFMLLLFETRAIHVVEN